MPMIPKSTLKKVKALEIKTRSIVDSMLSGGYLSAFKGRGLHFSDIRPYQVGDDVRFIDWKVTAKMGGVPYVKLFQEERELTVILMVDVSGSQDFGGCSASKKDIAIELAAVLGFSAIRNQDNVGLILFSDQVELYIPPKKGKSHVLRMIRDMYVMERKGCNTDISAALDYLLRVQKKKAVVFLISDFIADSYERLLSIAASRHDLIPVCVSEPHERGFPKVGFVALQDAETGEVSYVYSGTARGNQQLSRFYDENHLRLDRFFQSKKLMPLRISTDGSYIEALIRFFKRRSQKR